MHAYLPTYPAVCLSVDGAYYSRKIEIDSYPMDPRLMQSVASDLTESSRD